MKIVQNTVNLNKTTLEISLKIINYKLKCQIINNFIFMLFFQLYREYFILLLRRDIIKMFLSIIINIKKNYF